MPEAIEFEKDNPENYHIEFIWSCANLRAQNYNIQKCDKLKAKIVAGKIIPALATTTSLVVSLSTIEFLKILNWKNNKLDFYKNSFLNMGLSLIVQSEPLPPVITKDSVIKFSNL